MNPLGPVPASEPSPAEWTQPSAHAILSWHYAVVPHSTWDHSLHPNYSWNPTKRCSAQVLHQLIKRTDVKPHSTLLQTVPRRPASVPCWLPRSRPCHSRQSGLPAVHSLPGSTQYKTISLHQQYLPGDSCLLRCKRCPGVPGHRRRSCWWSRRPSEAPGISCSTSSPSAWISNLVNLFLNHFPWRSEGLPRQKLKSPLLSLPR